MNSQLDMSISSDRVQAIKNGVTPRALEDAYSDHTVSEFAFHHKLYRPQVVELARVWGISGRGRR